MAIKASSSGNGSQCAVGSLLIHSINIAKMFLICKFAYLAAIAIVLVNADTTTSKHEDVVHWATANGSKGAATVTVKPSYGQSYLSKINSTSATATTAAAPAAADGAAPAAAPAAEATPGAGGGAGAGAGAAAAAGAEATTVGAVDIPHTEAKETTESKESNDQAKEESKDEDKNAKDDKHVKDAKKTKGNRSVKNVKDSKHKF